MRNTRFLPIRAMTKDDVLNTIRDSYRFAQKLDPESEPGYDLTFDTTIEAWRTACNLLPARELGHAVNVWFGVHFSDIDWMATLEPAKTATIGGVCDLVASKAKMPDIREFPILGTECLSAGVFLTIRTALAKEGVPAEGMRPSTPLEPVAREHFGPLIQTVGRVAPDVLPVPDVKHKLTYRVSLWLSGGGLVLTLVLGVWGSRTGSSVLALARLVSLLAGLAGLVLVNYFGPGFERVSFPGVKTFGDLTEAIIRRTHEPRNP